MSLPRIPSSSLRDRIPLSEPHLTESASRYLEECLRTNYVSSVGPFVDRFEREFADAVGARYAVACSSGTAAIHVAMRVLDIGPGDEVFVPTFTFVASANPILYQGATPVLIDSEHGTWNLDVSLVMDEVESRARRGAPMPKAIEAVHILGRPAELERLLALCDRHGIPLIEDAAESLGASFAAGGLVGKQVGTVGRIGCFSFNGNKLITTGGGGMLTTDDERLALRAKHLTTQARTPGRAYYHDEVGYNYRLTNLAAALGVSQLESLVSFLETKRRLAIRYSDKLRNVVGITIPPSPPWAHPSFWLYSVLLETEQQRDLVLERLKAYGIEARPLWTPLHLMPPFRDSRVLGGGVVANGIASRGLSLPSSVTLTELDQDRVIAAVEEALMRPSSS